MLETFVWLALAANATVMIAAEDETPTSLDPRLAIVRFAAEPEIVTPVGIAVDGMGRVLVVENHTHFRPPDYAGPPADRIRAFVDTDGDGKSDRVTNFYEGGKNTMNLAVYEDGSVFVATRSEIFRLHDRDGDGQADQHISVAHLESAGDYPHNGLSGFAFDGQGNVCFGLGENLGVDYRLVGADGTTISGGGEGGSIYRCRPDGSGLERLATGFWNPFHVCVDAFDRLFAVDNDPDSRPPCRLLHIVPGGDYGYRLRNGRKGIHPFTAWNGELPGTLPMTAGTGEAPSGVLAYESDQLPQEYRGTLLVTSWGDHRIDRFRLQPRGASFRASAEAIISGGEKFRPVGIALAPDGSLFVSDWVDRSYAVHGKGRVWHIRARDATPPFRSKDPRLAVLSRHRPLRQWAARKLARSAEVPADQAAANVDFLADVAVGSADAGVRADAVIALANAGRRKEIARRVAASDPSPDLRALAVRLMPDRADELLRRAEEDTSAEVRAEALRRLAVPHAMSALLAALVVPDPFVQQAARFALARSTTVDEQLRWAAAETADVRLAALELLRESTNPAARKRLPQLLADSDPAVRFAAVQWVAEAGLSEFREQIVAGLQRGATTRSLFEAYLAALERLGGAKRGAKDEWSGEQYVLELIVSTDTPPAVRARALRALRPDHPGLTSAVISRLIDANDLPTQLEAVRTLRERRFPTAMDLLARVAADVQRPIALRAEAIVGLTSETPAQLTLLLTLATQDDAVVRHEALRSMRGAELDADQRRRLSVRIEKESDPQLITRLLGTQPTRRQPDRRDTAGWLTLLQTPGDAAAGERIFFHPRGPMCYRCHQVDGRGGTIGPDLSMGPQSLPIERLLQSLLEPSKEVAPQFTVWNVVRRDGTTFVGILLADEPDGTRRYGGAEGQIITTKQVDIADARPQSVSIMPDNLCDLLTLQELRDLLAYLRQVR